MQNKKSLVGGKLRNLTSSFCSFLFLFVLKKCWYFQKKSLKMELIWKNCVGDRATLTREGRREGGGVFLSPLFSSLRTPPPSHYPYPHSLKNERYIFSVFFQMCTWALILNGGAGHWRRKREGLTTRGGWFFPLPFSATTAERIIQPALPTPLPMPRLLQRSLSLSLSTALSHWSFSQHASVSNYKNYSTFQNKQLQQSWSRFNP